MRNSHVVVHANDKRHEFFFSTDHCQGVRAKETYPADFVAHTIALPHGVVPRAALPSGVVRVPADVVAVYFPLHLGWTEIPNPDVRYQAERKYILLQGVIPYEPGKEGNQLCKFFTSYTEGKDHTKLADGTEAYAVIGFANTEQEAQKTLYGRVYDPTTIEEDYDGVRPGPLSGCLDE